jgi:type I restriction-modification system DNA methylase subunit
MPKALQEDLKVLATAGLILTDAMIFHEVLANLKAEIETLSQIKAQSNIKKAFEDEWIKILEIDYEPVFELALKILRHLPASPLLNRELRRLLDVAYDIASSHALLKHDLMGRVYHQLLLGKLVKYYATYYTSVPAARLLARLLVTLPSPLKVSEIPPKYGKQLLKAADFACGSGTLLSALYKELEARHRIRAEEPNVGGLHEYMVEEGLWGFDVLQHATHLAMTTLSLHNPSTSVDLSRIYALKLGKFNKNVFLGSPDFLKSPDISPVKLQSGGVGAERVGVSQRKAAEGEKVPNIHLCIMNPPFTRSVGGNLLFGDLPSKERKELQKVLSNLLKKEGLTGIGQAGLGAVFVHLGDKYLAAGGRLGLVLPKAVLAGVSWTKVRELFLENYHVEYVISTFQGPTDWNFSENTSLSEILLVVRKRSKNKDGDHTIFVNLFRKPENEIESVYIGSQLAELYEAVAPADIENANASPFSVKLHGKKVADVYSARLTEEAVGHYNFFAQAELNRITTLIRGGTLYLPTRGIVGRIPLTTLNSFIDYIGPDRRQVHSAFRHIRYMSQAPYKSLWGHDPDKIKCLEQNPNASLEPKNAKVARNLWKRKGNLVIVEGVRLSTCRVLSAFLTQDVLSNVWWPIRTALSVKAKNYTLSSEETAKTMALWINSTLGTLCLLSIAEVTEGPWVAFKKTPLWKLPVLNIRKLNKKQVKELLNLYPNVRHTELQPLPKEFRKPRVRKKLDDKFNEILGLDVNLNTLYSLLSKDPTITGEAIEI